MKKYQKVLLITAGCLMLAGGIVMTTGFAMGGKLGFRFNENGIVSSEDRGEYVEKTESLKEVKNLELVLNDGNLYIEQGNKFEIQYGYYDKFNVCEKKNENSKTIYQIKYRSTNNNFSSFGFADFSEPENETYMKLIVPKDTELEQLTINSDYGRVTLDTAKINKLIVNMESGNAKMTNLDTKSMKVDMDYGTFQMEDSKISDLNISNSSGDMKLSSIDSESLLLKSEYGGVKIEDMTTNKAEINNENGSIVMNNVKGISKNKNMESLILDGQYGDMKLNNIKTDNIVINNENGSVKGGEITALKGKIRLDYGNVNLDEVDTSQLDITSDSGSIDLGLVKAEKEYGFELDADEGDVEINGNKKRHSISKSSYTDNMINAVTEYGHISIRTK